MQAKDRTGKQGILRDDSCLGGLCSRVCLIPSQAELLPALLPAIHHDSNCVSMLKVFFSVADASTFAQSNCS